MGLTACMRVPQPGGGGAGSAALAAAAGVADESRLRHVGRTREQLLECEMGGQCDWGFSQGAARVTGACSCLRAALK